jgi:hypothetical protein
MRDDEKEWANALADVLDTLKEADTVDNWQQYYSYYLMMFFDIHAQTQDGQIVQLDLVLRWAESDRFRAMIENTWTESRHEAFTVSIDPLYKIRDDEKAGVVAAPKKEKVAKPKSPPVKPSNVFPFKGKGPRKPRF